MPFLIYMHGAQLRNKLDLIFGFGGIHDDIGAKSKFLYNNE